jgi:hypothetical protein
MDKPTKLLSQLERVTRTFEYYVGFDALAKAWRVTKLNGPIFGKFLEKKNAVEYAKVAATIEYRKSQNMKNSDFTIDGVYYSGTILEDVVLSDIDSEMFDDEIFGGIYE